MTQSKVTLPSGEYLFQEIPERTTRHFVGNVLESTWRPPGNWTLLGADPTRLTDGEAGEIVEKIYIEETPSPYNDMAGGYHYGFVDYQHRGEFAGWQGDAGAYTKAAKSLDSLAASLQIEKPFVVLKKKA